MNMDERVARALGWTLNATDEQGFLYLGGVIPPFSTSVDTTIKYLVPAMRERGCSWLILAFGEVPDNKHFFWFQTQRPGGGL